MVKLASLSCLLLVLQSAPADVPVPTFAPPTREATAMSPAELVVTRAGVALYEQGKYDEAAAKYEEILKDHPDNAAVLYELALTAYAKKDLAKAVALGTRGTEYKCDALPQFYSLIGNAFDGAGQPLKAVDVYKKGLEVLPASGGLHYNLAVTQVDGLHDMAAAKATLKRGATADPTHAATHLLLAKLFLADDLRTPALLALSRFLILEPASSRTGEGYNIWVRLLGGNMAQNGQGGVTIGVNPGQKKDEGDLTQLDLNITLSRLTAMRGAGGGSSQIATMANQVDMLFQVYGKQAGPADSVPFLWSYYMPYMLEMQQKKFVEPFVYYVSQRTNLPGVREWLAANRDRVTAFLDWSRSYAWPKA